MTNQTPSESCPECGKLTKAKRYIGSEEHYFVCSCYHSWGGEETPRKKQLLHAAAAGDLGEEAEVEGRL